MKIAHVESLAVDFEKIALRKNIAKEYSILGEKNCFYDLPTELYYITGESAPHCFLAKKCHQKHGGF